MAPASEKPGDITQLLAALEGGDSAVAEKLASLVYGELRRIAGVYFRRERAGHTLQPTALVNEALSRLMNGKLPSIASRAHFFAIAAQSMRRILIDHARRKKSVRRGSGESLLELDEELFRSNQKSSRLVALDDALTALEQLDPRQSRIVVMKFFAGMTDAEIAAVLRISISTLQREWRSAKAWLRREMDS